MANAYDGTQQHLEAGIAAEENFDLHAYGQAKESTKLLWMK